jgi:hypothetical protein
MNSLTIFFIWWNETGGPWENHKATDKLVLCTDISSTPCHRQE